MKELELQMGGENRILEGKCSENQRKSKAVGQAEERYRGRFLVKHGGVAGWI